MLTLNLCFSFCDVLASVWMGFVPQCECNMFELDICLFGLGAPTLHAKWGPISMGTGDPVASASQVGVPRTTCIEEQDKEGAPDQKRIPMRDISDNREIVFF